MAIDTNTLLAIIAVCVTIAFCLFFLAFQRLIKATMFGKIQCGACQGSGRVCIKTNPWPDLREYRPCVTCGSVGYLPFKTGGDK